MNKRVDCLNSFDKCNSKNSYKKVSYNKNFASVICFVVLLLYSLTIFIALLWAFSSAFKGRFDFRENPIWFPSRKWGWKFTNFKEALDLMFIPVNIKGHGVKNVYGTEMFLNSLIFSVGCTFFTVVSHLLVSYACARYKFIFKKIIYNTVLIVMIIPIVGSLSSEIVIARKLFLYDNFFGMFFMKCGFASIYFLIFYGVFKGLPNSFFESAKMDGAGNWMVLIKIALPLATSTIAAVAIMLFIGFWNDYYTPMIYLPSSPVISYGLYKLQFSNITEVTEPIKLAGAIIVSLPVLFLFIVFRNKIMGNIAVGGIKS